MGRFLAILVITVFATAAASDPSHARLPKSYGGQEGYGPQGDPAAIVKAAIAAACRAPAPDIDKIADALPAVTSRDQKPLTARGQTFGWRGTLTLANGGRIEIERIAPGGRLRRLGVTYYAPHAPGATQPRPLITARVRPDCLIGLARRLVYGPEGRAQALEHLDGELAPTGTAEPLDPPVPSASRAGEGVEGVPVAMVDAGVNYLLPEIAPRLARDRAGRPLGYDFWDLDGRPFDSNPARSPFFPQRHGTRTASVLLREAPEARLVPYRYPRPEMSRMAKIVDHAAANGVVVVCITLGSNDIADWQAFAAAAAARPDMLFVVSAGNNGRDIDQRPVYPAALKADNIITVTSADASGRLARGSNWGKRSVDLLVPGEEIPVTDFHGRATVSSGSSFAAPRIAALAARLLAAHPNWRAPELRAAIFARARKTAATVDIVSQGLIADPTAP